MGLQKCGLNLDHTNKELQPHGTLEFPCAGYSSLYTGSAADIIPWHWHTEMEIIYSASGVMKLQIPGKVIYLNEREAFFINSNILHSAEAEPFCKLHSLVFHPLLLTGTGDSAFANKYITPLTNCTSLDGCLLREADDFITAFEAFSAETAGYEFVTREKLSSICLALYQNYEKDIRTCSGESGTDGIRIQKMLAYIHDHFSENLELSQIAKAADIGERECLRCFQRVIQVSPMQYLLKYRVMQGSSMLLRNLNSSISDISGHCGFDSPSNFSQMFKRFFNCTPREYRKRG